MMPKHPRRTAALPSGNGRAASAFSGVLSIAVPAVLLSACTYDKSLVQEVPPEAPSARLLRLMPPTQRDTVFPPPEKFSARTWVDRLVCANGEQPGWKRTKRKGMVETYEVSCPGESAFETSIDTAGEEPPPKAGMRLVDSASYKDFARSVALSQSKTYDKALAAIDRALEQQPQEPVYRLERVSILYGQERWAEALVESQVLARESNTPVAWKFAALSAQKLSLHGIVKEHVRRFAESCGETHPLYGEATCAHGLYRLADAPDEGLAMMKKACAAKYKPCCEAVERREREQELERLQSLPE